MLQAIRLGFIGLIILAVGCAVETATKATSPSVSQQDAGNETMIYEVLTETMCNRLTGSAEVLNAGLITEGDVRQTVKEIWEQLYRTVPGVDEETLTFALKGVDVRLKETVPLESKPFIELQENCVARQLIPAIKEAQQKSN